MGECRIFSILVLPGDHVGPEVMAEALKVLKVIEKTRSNLQFNISTDLVGGCSIDKHGLPITEEVLSRAAQSDAVLFGSVGGPEWKTADPTPETGLLRLRVKLDAVANIRPCEIFPSLIGASTVKPEFISGLKFIVVRENCGGAYSGKKTEGANEASDLWLYTRQEVERLSRVSAAVARMLHLSVENRDHLGKPTVWSADKANVLANSRLWRRVTTEMFQSELSDVKLYHQLADSFAMLMVRDPMRFNHSVIHTENTFGDILSDLSGGITGTLGILPSASIAGVPGEGPCKGIFEPIHGSAPDISGQGLANPIGQILSLALMLRYSFALEAEAVAVERAVRQVLDDKESGGLGLKTRDLGGNAKCSEVGDAVCEVLANLLSESEEQTRHSSSHVK